MAAPEYNPQLKRFVVVDRINLPHIHSASGHAEVPEGHLVVCDDGTDLFLLGPDGSQVGNWRITAPPPVIVDGRVPKKHKRDFESIASWRQGRATQMLIFGSGSKLPQRVYVVLCQWEKTLLSHTEVQAEAFYKHLMAAAGCTEADLNIEGAAAFDNKLVLFNRGLNQRLLMDLKATWAYLSGGCKGPAPAVEVHAYALPSIDGVPLGFSGAATDLRRNRIYFCASAEDTTDWIADGEVKGSHVGWIVRPASTDGGEFFLMPVVDEGGATTKDKIEAIGLLPPVDGNVQLVAFTDCDGGPSEMLTLELRGRED